MIIWLRYHFDILSKHAEEQIMTSKENKTWNFISNKSSKKYRGLMVTEANIYDTQ